jgi:hypothetical protein
MRGLTSRYGQATLSPGCTSTWDRRSHWTIMHSECPGAADTSTWIRSFPRQTFNDATVRHPQDEKIRKRTGCNNRSINGSHTAAEPFSLTSSLLLYCSSFGVPVGAIAGTEAEALFLGSKMRPGCPMFRKIVARMIMLRGESVSPSTNRIGYLLELTRSPTQ